MDIYLNALDEEGYVRTIYLVNKEGVFWWSTKVWIEHYKDVQVYFNHEKRDVQLFYNSFNLKRVNFNFQEEDLAFLGETMQYSCTDTSRYSKILTWMPRNSVKTKKIIGGCDLWI